MNDACRADPFANLVHTGASSPLAFSAITALTQPTVQKHYVYPVPLIETLTMSIGASVARLLRLWFKDEALALDLSLSLVDLAERGGRGFKEKRGTW